MRRSIRHSILVNTVWLVGLVALLVVLVGGSISRITAAQLVVRNLEQEVTTQQGALDLFPDAQEFGQTLAALDHILEESIRMGESQAIRIAALSTAAREAGVTIVEMDSQEPRKISQERVLSCTHRLVGMGSYQQLAEFFDGIVAIPGLSTIDEVELTPLDATSVGGLRISFYVTWFAPGLPAGGLSNGGNS